MKIEPIVKPEFRRWSPMPKVRLFLFSFMLWFVSLSLEGIFRSCSLLSLSAKNNLKSFYCTMSHIKYGASSQIYRETSWQRKMKNNDCRGKYEEYQRRVWRCKSPYKSKCWTVSWLHLSLHTWWGTIWVKTSKSSSVSLKINQRSLQWKYFVSHACWSKRNTDYWS